MTRCGALETKSTIIPHYEHSLSHSTYPHSESQDSGMGQVLRMVNLLMLFISFLCIFNIF